MGPRPQMMKMTKVSGKSWMMTKMKARVIQLKGMSENLKQSKMLQIRYRLGQNGCFSKNPYWSLDLSQPRAKRYRSRST